MGMDTTAGAYAFVGAVARKNSEVAQQLLDSGLIILGKANLTVRTLTMFSFSTQIDCCCAGILRFEVCINNA